MILVRMAAVAALAVTLGCSAADAFPGSWHMGQMDQTGITNLGVNIQGAGSTPENIKAFLAGLPDGQAAQVVTACNFMVDHQANQPSSVLSFCQAVAGRR